MIFSKNCYFFKFTHWKALKSAPKFTTNSACRFSCGFYLLPCDGWTPRQKFATDSMAQIWKSTARLDFSFYECLKPHLLALSCTLLQTFGATSATEYTLCEHGLWRYKYTQLEYSTFIHYLQEASSQAQDLVTRGLTFSWFVSVLLNLRILFVFTGGKPFLCGKAFQDIED